MCRACEARPKEENVKRKRIRDGRDTLWHFLEQSRVSERNMETIDSLLEIGDPRFHKFAELIQTAVRLKPGKKRRWMWLGEHHPEIIRRVEAESWFDWLVDELNCQDQCPGRYGDDGPPGEFDEDDEDFV